MTSTSTNPGRERAAATALSLVLDYNTDQLKKQAEKKNLTRKSALPECRAPHDDLRQLPGTRQRQPQATSRPIAPAPVPSDRHAPPERASASRYTSHRPRPGRLRQRQYHPIATRHPSEPAPAATPATGHVRADCASADQTAAAITAATAMEKHLKNADSSRRSAPRSPAPLPTNSPPLAPQTDTTSAVFSARYKLEGGGHRQRDAAAQNRKHFLLLYRRRFCELC